MFVAFVIVVVSVIANALFMKYTRFDKLTRALKDTLNDICILY